EPDGEERARGDAEPAVGEEQRALQPHGPIVAGPRVLRMILNHGDTETRRRHWRCLVPPSPRGSFERADQRSRDPWRALLEYEPASGPGRSPPDSIRRGPRCP